MHLWSSPQPNVLQLLCQKLSAKSCRTHTRGLSGPTVQRLDGAATSLFQGHRWASPVGAVVCGDSPQPQVKVHHYLSRNCTIKYLEEARPCRLRSQQEFPATSMLERSLSSQITRRETAKAGKRLLGSFRGGHFCPRQVLHKILGSPENPFVFRAPLSPLPI